MAGACLLPMIPGNGGAGTGKDLTVDATLSARCDDVTRRGRPTEILRELLALRATDPFASQSLARLVGSQPTFLEGVRAGYRFVARYGDRADSPLAWQRRMRARDTVPLAGAPPVAVGARGDTAPRIHPSGTPRDVVEFNGYRLTHALAVACEVVALLEPGLRAPAAAPAWRSVFVTATYAMVLAGALRRHEDDAFAGAFLAGTGALLCDGRRSGASPSSDACGFARELAERWALPDAILQAFADDGPEGSLSDIVRRAAAAASRHGVGGRVALMPSPDRAPPCEPALDDYLRECGGPAAVTNGIGAMMAIALIASE